MGTIPEVEVVLVAKPRTVVLWKDGTYSSFICSPNDTFDLEKAVLLAFFGKVLNLTNKEVTETLKEL